MKFPPTINTMNEIKAFLIAVQSGAWLWIFTEDIIFTIVMGIGIGTSFFLLGEAMRNYDQDKKDGTIK